MGRAREVPHSPFPISYSLFPIPYSLFPIPYSLVLLHYLLERVQLRLHFREAPCHLPKALVVARSHRHPCIAWHGRQGDRT